MDEDSSMVEGERREVLPSLDWDSTGKDCNYFCNLLVTVLDCFPTAGLHDPWFFFLRSGLCLIWWVFISFLFIWLLHSPQARSANDGIAVTNAGPAYFEEVADYAVGLLMDVLRRISASDCSVSSGLWSSRGDFPFFCFQGSLIFPLLLAKIILDRFLSCSWMYLW